MLSRLFAFREGNVMRRLSVFNNMSLDGFIADSKGSMDWAHKAPDDAEWNAFTASNASSGGVLVYGRTTYDMMAGFWPTEAAMQMMPDVARGMNGAQKIVFSRTMKKADWQNSALYHDAVADMRRLKQEPGGDMVILGSASIVAQLSEVRLIDAYMIAVAPIVLGDGKSMFAGLSQPMGLALTDSRRFANGTLVQSYEVRG